MEEPKGRLPHSTRWLCIPECCRDRCLIAKDLGEDFIPVRRRVIRRAVSIRDCERQQREGNSRSDGRDALARQIQLDAPRGLGENNGHRGQDYNSLALTNRGHSADFRPVLLCGDAVENVRFGSKADMTLLNLDVRFTPESGHSLSAIGCLLWATSRHRLI